MSECECGKLWKRMGDVRVIKCRMGEISKSGYTYILRIEIENSLNAYKPEAENDGGIK